MDARDTTSEKAPTVRPAEAPGNETPKLDCPRRATAGASPGRLPARVGTVLSQVLADLLDGHKLTALDGLGRASTMRLAAAAFTLSTDYGWRIEVEGRAAGCRDGRLARVARYELAAEVRATARRQPEVAEWVRRVRRARAELRQRAADAMHRAAAENARRDAAARAGQGELFGSAT